MVDISTYGGYQHPKGIPGQLIKITSAFTIDGYFNNKSVPIDFGVAVAKDTTAVNVYPPFAAKAVDNDADIIVGLSVLHYNNPADYESGQLVYNEGDRLSVMTQGYMYAVCTETAASGDGVIVLTASTDPYGQLGSTTGGAVGAGRVALPNAIWQGDVAAGEIGIVKMGVI